MIRAILLGLTACASAPGPGGSHAIENTAPRIEPIAAATGSVVIGHPDARWTLELRPAGRVFVDGVHRVTIEPDGDIFAIDAIEPYARHHDGVVAPTIYGQRYSVDSEGVVRDEEGIIFRFDAGDVLSGDGPDFIRAPMRYTAAPAHRRALAVTLCAVMIGDFAHEMWRHRLSRRGCTSGTAGSGCDATP